MLRRAKRWMRLLEARYGRAGALSLLACSAVPRAVPIPGRPWSPCFASGTRPVPTATILPRPPGGHTVSRQARCMKPGETPPTGRRPKAEQTTKRGDEPDEQAASDGSGAARTMPDPGTGGKPLCETPVHGMMPFCARSSALPRRGP
jgi:hypothetical protein